MPKYKITVEELSPLEGSNYNKYEKETIYEQTVDELDMKALISVINRIDMSGAFEITGTHIIPKPNFQRRTKKGGERE